MIVRNFILEEVIEDLVDKWQAKEMQVDAKVVNHYGLIKQIDK